VSPERRAAWEKGVPKNLMAHKNADMAAGNILERIDGATRETDASVQWDGSTWSW
jgi:hypothetical protein